MRLVVIWTMRPLPRVSHLGDRELGDVEESRQIDPQDRRVIGLRVSL
jgi:hypothetical protein